MLSTSTLATVAAVLAMADAQAAYGAPLPYGQAPAYNTTSAAVTPYGTAVSSSAVASPSASTGCLAKYDDCRVAPDANMAYCASQYAACLGYNPFTATPSAPVYYTTEVVTALTTYCPSATTLTHGTKTYTITSATTLTITDCPCTITKSSVPTTTAATCNKQSVYNACIQSAVNAGNAPNFAECNASSAGACETAVPATSTASKPAATSPAASKPVATTSVASKPASSAPAASAPAASKPAASKPAVTTGCAVSQIADGQPQAPGACTAAPAHSSAASKPVTAASQAKATTTAPRPAVYTGAAVKEYGSFAAVALGAAMAVLA